MALITRGNIDDFAAEPIVETGNIASAALPEVEMVSTLKTFRTLENATRIVQPLRLGFTTSPEERGIALKSLMLRKEFGGLLSGLRRRAYRVYFVAWTWDFSGQPASMYPGSGSGADQCLIRLRAGDVREFLGAGTVLFPARPVTSGISVRIQLWQSKGKVREFGLAMAEVAKAVQSSELNQLLTVGAIVTGATTATLALAKDAAVELARLVGIVLQKRSDDFVDYFDGSYPISEVWSAGDERNTGFASEIVIRRLT